MKMRMGTMGLMYQLKVLNHTSRTLPRLPYTKYKLGYVKSGSTTFKVQKDGCDLPSAARALLVPRVHSLSKLESSNGTLYVESISPRGGWTLYVQSHFHGPMGIRAI